MSDPVFFTSGGPVSLAEIAAMAGIDLPAGIDGTRTFSSVAPLENAGPDDLAYMDNPRYGEALASTRAGAVLVSSRYAAKVSEGAIALITPQPYHVFAQVLARLFPTAMNPQPLFSSAGISAGAIVHPDAKLEDGVAVDPGAVIGPGAEIGKGTLIGANAVIGANVRIGRDCKIGSGVSLSHALLGNRIIIHPGARIGQDGFGFSMSGSGHMKVPQIGRVVIHDDVEIGANTTIDRGASRDTIIGEGTKIDNLVQIAHNVVIGRHCVIVSHVGISGSTTLGDFVVLGGKAGIIGHITIGTGVQVAAGSGVTMDLPPGTKWGGSPAQPLKDWLRETVWLRKMISGRGNRQVSEKNSKEN